MNIYPLTPMTKEQIETFKTFGESSKNDSTGFVISPYLNDFIHGL